jgi:isoamylase
VSGLLAVRRRFPLLQRGRFLNGEWDEELGLKDVTWLTPDNDEMLEDHWTEGHARCMGMLLDGRAQATGIQQRGTDATLLLIFNAHHDVVTFLLPEVVGGREWRLLIDTRLADGGFDSEVEGEESPFPFEHPYAVTGRSFLLFELVLDPSYASARTRRRERLARAPVPVDADQSFATTIEIAEEELAAEEA